MKYFLALVLLFTMSALVLSINQTKAASNMDIKLNENLESLIRLLSKVTNTYVGDYIEEADYYYDIQLGPESNMYRKYNYLSDSEWFTNDMSAHFEDTFIEFAGESNGSSFNLWYYPKLIGAPPVVYIGSDGPNSTIAASMEEFICLLATSSEFNTMSAKPKEIWTKLHLEYFEDEDTNSELYNGLKQRMELASNILSCNSHKKLLKNIKKHPNFHEWVEKVREKDESI